VTRSRGTTPPSDSIDEAQGTAGEPPDGDGSAPPPSEPTRRPKTSRVTTRKKTTSKKTTAKKTAAKKTTAKKTTAKKTTAKKTTAKKAAAKQAGAEPPPATKKRTRRRRVTTQGAETEPPAGTNESTARRSRPAKAKSATRTTKRRRSTSPTGGDDEALTDRRATRRKPAEPTADRETRAGETADPPVGRKRVKRSVRTVGRKAAIKSARKVTRPRSRRPPAEDRHEAATELEDVAELGGEPDPAATDSTPPPTEREDEPATSPPADEPAAPADGSTRDGGDPAAQPAPPANEVTPESGPADAPPEAARREADEVTPAEDVADVQPAATGREADTPAGDEPAPTSSAEDHDEPGQEDGEPPSPAARRRPMSGPRQPVRRRRFRIGLAALALVILAGAAVTLLPMYLLSRAKHHASDCFRQIIKTGAGDPDRCLPGPRAIALAERVPWFAGEATQLRQDTAYRAADLTYGQATAIRPNAEARSAAVDGLFRSAPGWFEPRHSVASRLAPWQALQGAFDDLTRVAVASEDPALRGYAFKSARAIAAIEPLRDLSLGGAPTDHFALNLARGAMLCMLGETAGGAVALRHADQLVQEHSDEGEGYGRARLALLACGPGAAEPGAPPPLPPAMRAAAAALAASHGTDAGLDEVGALLDDRSAALIGEHRLRIASFLIRETKPDPVAALAILVPRTGPAAKLDLATARTPWVLLDGSTTLAAVLVDPAAAETAAAHLQQLLAALGDEPLRCAGQECPVEVALTMPDRLLREAARMLWFEAAVEHARAGRRDEALGAINHATELTPDRRKHASAAVHLAVGDAEGARQAIAPSLGAKVALPPTLRTRALINEALALAHLGRTKEAHRTAQEAFMAALEADSKPPAEDHPGYAAPQERAADRRAAAWLWAALALEVDQGGETIALLRETGGAELAALAQWLELATMNEEERRPLRWSLRLQRPPSSVLPAVMALAARVAPGDTDREVWLDRLFHDEQRRQPVRGMLARAEAARWRGDPDAERRWLERAARLRKLQVDYPTSLLAHLADLR